MDEKDDMRRAMLAARKDCFDSTGRDAAQALAAQADKLSGKTIAAYLPMGGEIDPQPLIDALCAEDKTLCLPVCVDDDAPLIFRRHKKAAPLLPDAMGIAAPRATAAQVTPDAVLLPLLAFDGAGNRLGRGGGFYDRTLAKLRQGGDCRFIGLAFDMQMVDKCPVAPHDEAMHGVLTPSRFIEFDRD